MRRVLCGFLVASALVGLSCSAGDDAASADGPGGPGRFGELRVADEAGADFYDRDLFPTWDTVAGCSVRERVLIDESRSIAQVDPFGCKVIAGDWISVYDSIETSDPTDLEIDHLVPLAEAWRSGAWAWPDDKRKRFANDLDDPDTLVAVSSASNQAKADSDPAEWRPSEPGAWCRYANHWITIKQRWDLTIDTDERRALSQMLDAC